MTTTGMKSGKASRKVTTPNKRSAPEKREPGEAAGKWNLKLYVAGHTPKSIAAFTNLQAFCKEHLPGQYNIEVIDLLKTPQLARDDQIVAIPTLVRRVPSPIRKIIGDLSKTERVLVGFDLKPR